MPRLLGRLIPVTTLILPLILGRQSRRIERRNINIWKGGGVLYLLGRHVGWRVIVLRRSGHRHRVHLSRSHVRGSWLGLGQSRASGRLRRVRVRHRTSGMEGRGHGTASAAVAVLLARRETHVGIVRRVLRVEATASAALRLEPLTVWALVRTDRPAHIAVLRDARFSSNMRARLGGQSALGLRSGGLSHVALQRVVVSKGTNDMVYTGVMGNLHRHRFRDCQMSSRRSEPYQKEGGHR